MIQVAIPALALLIALILYVKRPAAYLSYTLWVWFLAPLVRRLADWQFGWHEQSLILLSPLLVTSVGLLPLLVPSSRKGARLPPALILCAAGVIYGFLVGMLLRAAGPAEVVFGLLNWMIPVIGGAYIVLDWERYEANRNALLKTFVWASGVMGAYGIYQFFVAPPWDAFWLQNVSRGLIDPSFGQPEPMLMRVWSTLNAPGPFGGTMMVALLFVVVARSPLKIPMAAFGYIGFLLSAVRAAWLGWVVGLVLILRKAKPQLLVRVIGSMIVLVACILPVLQNPNLAPGLSDRLSSLTTLKKDESFRERQDMYKIVGGVILNEPFGRGLRNGETVQNLAVDSGILATLLSLGWLGTALYLSGVALFMLQSSGEGTGDTFIFACRAICLSSLAQYVGANIFVGLGGYLFWLCAGGSMAGTLWHRDGIAAEDKSDVAYLSDNDLVTSHASGEYR